MIRDLVAKDDRKPAAEPDREKPAAAPAPDQAARAAPDRWAHLRAAFAEDEASEQDAAPDSDQIDAPEPVRTVSPIERIRARDAAGRRPAAPAAPQADPEMVAYDESVFGASGTDDEAAKPVLEAPEPPEAPSPQMTQRVWDTPADHVMSAKGRMAWRLAIYGPVVVVPVILLAMSPFSPKDTVAHYAAAAGCKAAEYMGVESAETGEPGYHAHLDDNGNGVACEPMVQRTLKGNGRAAFIRVGDY